MAVHEAAKENVREYFGLRDYYNFVKMVFSFVKNSENETRILTWTQIQYAVLRNFSGLEEIDPVAIFKETMETAALDTNVSLVSTIGQDNFVTH